MQATSEDKFTGEINANLGIIHKICNIYFISEQDRQDAQQEILYQLWKSYPSFKGDAKFSTWMYKVKNGKEVNYNYYDSKELATAVRTFITDSIRKLIGLGIYTEECICLGTGKNEKFLNQLNNEFHFFGKITALEHPRFIMQYKSKSMNVYIDKYVSALNALNGKS